MGILLEYPGNHQVTPYIGDTIIRSTIKSPIDVFASYKPPFIGDFLHFPMIFPWFSHDFPMNFPWFSHDFPMIFPWFSHDFPMIFPWIFHDFPMITTSIGQEPPGPPCCVPCASHWCATPCPLRARLRDPREVFWGVRISYGHPLVNKNEWQ